MINEKNYKNKLSSKNETRKNGGNVVLLCIEKTIKFAKSLSCANRLICRQR